MWLKRKKALPQEKSLIEKGSSSLIHRSSGGCVGNAFSCLLFGAEGSICRRRKSMHGYDWHGSSQVSPGE